MEVVVAQALCRKIVERGHLDRPAKCAGLPEANVVQKDHDHAKIHESCPCADELQGRVNADGSRAEQPGLLRNVGGTSDGSEGRAEAA
jgi:hypothetical protein